ncbi:MAG: 2,3-diaminopropionate biosynthesis protein SbnA [Actinomycetota bacterium]|nr:2,3-diaminopropionate biosynthesis protein SbnA [Actinomycetota bacterium]
MGRVMIFVNGFDIVLDDVFVALDGFVPGVEVYLKLEGLNPAGSIKLKTAVALIEDAEADGRIRGGSRIIESTSGNLGAALAQICAAKRYPLTLVTDPNANARSIRAIESLGADVVRVQERDDQQGFLQTRIDYILARLSEEPDLVWLNQYANAANMRAHRDQTATAIHKELGAIDALFVGAGTTGTLMGCARYFGEHSPHTRIVAVDAVGSVTFGHPAGKRHLTGLGTSRRPELLDDDGTFEKVMVSEPDSIRMCHHLARRYGLLLGASTGTVLVAVRRLSGTLPPGSRVVVISPDLGEKYFDNVYSRSWVAERYPGVFDATGPS